MQSITTKKKKKIMKTLQQQIATLTWITNAEAFAIVVAKQFAAEARYLSTYERICIWLECQP